MKNPETYMYPNPIATEKRIIIASLRERRFPITSKFVFW